MWEQLLAVGRLMRPAVALLLLTLPLPLPKPQPQPQPLPLPLPLPLPSLNPNPNPDPNQVALPNSHGYPHRSRHAATARDGGGTILHVPRVPRSPGS